VHTEASDGFNSLEEIIRYARKIGLNGIAVTDHDIITVKKNIVFDDGFIVIRGVEVSSKQGHIILLDVEEAPPKNSDIWEIIDYAKEIDALIIIPHPFDFLRNGIRRLAWDIPADAIEVINSGSIFDFFNKKARRLAEKRGIPMVAGSDAHMVEEMGYAYTIINASISSPEDVLDAIRKGLTIPYGGRYSVFKKIKRKLLRLT